MGLTKRLAMMAVANHPERFRPEFSEWLDRNHAIYLDFERRAKEIAQFRAHYSARTIAEVMRHETTLRELGSEFKLNGNVVPDLARLFVILNPHYAGLFEFRSCGDKRVA